MIKNLTNLQKGSGNMCIEKLYALYEVEALTGIDVENLAGMIEENRLDAVLVGGEYRITKSSVARWAADVLNQM